MENLAQLDDSELDRLIKDVEKSESSNELDWAIEKIMEEIFKRRAGAEKTPEKGEKKYGAYLDYRMKMFVLQRYVDVTGTSGTGVVGEGIKFGDGTCVIRWKGTTPTTTVYNSIKDIEMIHGHNGGTEIVWLEP